MKFKRTLQPYWGLRYEVIRKIAFDNDKNEEIRIQALKLLENTKDFQSQDNIESLIQEGNSRRLVSSAVSTLASISADSPELLKIVNKSENIDSLNQHDIYLLLIIATKFAEFNNSRDLGDSDYDDRKAMSRNIIETLIKKDFNFYAETRGGIKIAFGFSLYESQLVSDEIFHDYNLSEVIGETAQKYLKENDTLSFYKLIEKFTINEELSDYDYHYSTGLGYFAGNLLLHSGRKVNHRDVKGSVYLTFYKMRRENHNLVIVTWVNRYNEIEQDVLLSIKELEYGASLRMEKLPSWFEVDISRLRKTLANSR